MTFPTREALWPPNSLTCFGTARNMSSMDNRPLSKAIARLGIKVIYISLGYGSYIGSRECCSFLCKYTFSLEVLTCAKGYSAHHLFPESLRVCMFVYAHSRQTNGSLFSASHQCALEAKQAFPAQETSLGRLGHLWAFPGPDGKNGECIGRMRPE